MTSKKTDKTVTPVAPGDSAGAPQTSAPEVLNADQLVASLIADLPGLVRLQPLMRHVAALISYHRLNVPIEKALEFLEVADIKPSTLKPGIEAIEAACDKEAGRFVQEFYEKTGRQLDPVTLNFNPATEEELAEQATLRQKAVELRADISNLEEGLFGAVKERGLVEGWIQNAKLKVTDLIYVEEVDLENKTPGWKTPPKLDEADPEVGKLLKKIDLLKKTRAEFADPSVALKQLSNIGFSEADVKNILASAEALAGEQIIQSGLIESLVTEHEKQSMAVKVAKIVSARVIAKEADDYLKM